MSENEQAAVEYAVDSGWLVEVVNEHTCGTAAGGYYGAHEPGCGMVPVARIDDLLNELTDARRALRAWSLWRLAECSVRDHQTGAKNRRKQEATIAWDDWRKRWDDPATPEPTHQPPPEQAANESEMRG